MPSINDFSGLSCVKVSTKECLSKNHCLGNTCVRLDLADGELLTIEEREILKELGNLYVSLSAIIGNTSSGDQREMVSHIHNLQRMVMSQAAARRYPKLIRKLGETHG